MIGTHPVAAARVLLEMTILVLPSDTRERYREEFRTELCELRPVSQISEAVSLLRGSFALRQALRERQMTLSETHVDWRCHIGIHHYVLEVDDNPEVRGQTVQHCTRCGKHNDGRPAGPPLGPAAAGLAFPGAG